MRTASPTLLPAAPRSLLGSLLGALLFSLVPAALVLAEPGEFSRPIKVRLKSGNHIIGRVLEKECSDEALVMRELRSKMKRKIRWGDVKDSQAHELRVKLGFEVKERESGLRLTGVEIKTKSGATFRGLLTNKRTAEKDGVYILKRADGERRISVGDVRSGPTEVEMDALEVYTPTELYTERVKKSPPQTAEEHFRMGDFAAFIGALAQAKMHFEKCIEMGSEKYPDSLVKRHLERVETRLGNAEAENLLKEIGQATWRKRWKAAADLVKAFREKYGEDEDLMKALGRLEAALRERRQGHFAREVPRQLRRRIKSLLGKKVRISGELTLREATDYAGGEPSDEKSVAYEAILALSEKLGISDEEVLEFWNLRGKRAIQKAFYRDGTFIVIENLEDALAKAPKPKTGKNMPRPPKPNPIKTPEGWFKSKRKARKYSDLRDFLYAWWADNSSMVDLLEPKSEICNTCHGRGFTQSMITTNQGSIPFYNRCSTCYMAKSTRVVRFK